LSGPIRRARHAKRGKVPKLSADELAAGLLEIPGWTLDGAGADGARLRRGIKFKDFVALMRFVNRMADLAEAENHHPDFAVHYNQLDLTLWTHDAGGLTENDLVLAAGIDALLAAG
jgi:4a-hydroxytetrahydrobiopterin dehydratase